MVIAEAARFPDLGTLYWERGFLRVLASIAACLAILDECGLLDVPDADLAAQHFAGMMLWIPSNQTMFTAGTVVPDERRLMQNIDAGSAAFQRAYRPRSVPVSRRPASRAVTVGRGAGAPPSRATPGPRGGPLRR